MPSIRRPTGMLFILGYLAISLITIGDVEANESILDAQENESSQVGRLRRRLTDKPVKKELNEDTKVKRMKQYLGGLYPEVDEYVMPIYLRDTLKPIEENDVVFFWHIPKASGSTMKNIMNFCFKLKRAENIEGPPSMKFVRPTILNMDTTTPDGLQHAYESRLIDSNKIDVMVSNYFLSGSALFTEKYQGRVFTIMRHPIDLAESLFHYRKKASWEPSYRKDWDDMSFGEYVNSDMYMGNWMVHQLTGTMPWVDLNENHLERAKYILQTKVFVGIASQLDETLRQLKLYYGWTDDQPYCVFNYLHSTPTNANKHPQIPRGGDEWNLAAEKEKYDLSLYYYALELFAGQRERYPPDDAVAGISASEVVTIEQDVTVDQS